MRGRLCVHVIDDLGRGRYPPRPTVPVADRAGSGRVTLGFRAAVVVAAGNPARTRIGAGDFDFDGPAERAVFDVFGFHDTLGLKSPNQLATDNAGERHRVKRSVVLRVSDRGCSI